MKGLAAAGFALLSGLCSACVTGGAPPLKHPLPDGIYQHAVAVWTRPGGTQQFHGVLKVGGGRLSLVLLSAVDSTLLRITDAVDLATPQVQAYEPELQAHADEIEKVYLAVKPALVDLDATDVTLFGHAGKVVRQGTAAPGVPQVTTISGDGFRISMEVSAYAQTHDR